MLVAGNVSGGIEPVFAHSFTRRVLQPGGEPQPSTNDVTCTKKLKTAATCFNIKVTDHIVITPHGHCSLAAAGLI